MRRILCFGDSNTWGYKAGSGARFGRDARWTGILQDLLGPQFCIIEEGLNGRTTNIDYVNRKGRNGATYLAPCLDSHFPLDYLILFLGPNDTKVEFHRSAEDIKEGMAELIRIAKGQGIETPSPSLKILIVAPPQILEDQGSYQGMLEGASAKIKKMGSLYRELAQKENCLFIDFSHISPDPIDGVHLTGDSHLKIARAFLEFIKGHEMAST